VVGQLAYVTKYRPTGESQLAVIDIGDPAHPLTLGSVPIGYAPGLVQVIGSTAYASFYPYKQFGSGGFQIIDVHDPTNPRIQSTFIPSPFGTIGDFQVASGYAYLASNSDGFQILDISDPISPTLRASLTLGTAVRQVAVADTHAYIVYNEGQSNKFAAIDISDPASPALEMSISLPAMLSSPSDLQVAEAFVYISYGGYDTQGGVAIMDIHDPTTPVLLRFYQKNNAVELLRVIEDRLYLASGWAGLELASAQALNEQAWLPFALSQSIP
jgi:hypothetical protein